MNIKFITVAMGIVLTATAINASAQKAYTQGLLTVSMDMRGNSTIIKDYFTADSSSSSFTVGPATIKLLGDAKSTFYAVAVDVPVASIKKVAMLTPAEIEQELAGIPKFTYAAGTETKQISGFNCKKVVATDTKTKKTYDVWVTNDFSIPPGAIVKYYASIGGVPIQYTSFGQGQETGATVTGVSDTKAPAGTFSISPDFDKISYDDLKAMSGGGGN